MKKIRITGFDDIFYEFLLQFFQNDININFDNLKKLKKTFFQYLVEKNKINSVLHRLMIKD